MLRRTYFILIFGVIVSLFSFSFSIQISADRCVTTLLKNSANPVIEGVQSGSFTLVHTDVDDDTRLHVYKPVLRETFSEDKKVAVSVAYIDNYIPAAGLDFAVRPTYLRGSQFQVAITIAKQDKWISIHVQYLVSDKDDFVTGFFIPDQNNYLSNTKQFVLRDYVSQQIVVQDYESTVSMAFLSGLKCQHSKFQIKISRSFFDIEKSQIQIVVELNNPTQQIQIIYVSYIIFTSYSSITVTEVPNEDIFMAEFIQMPEKVIDQSFSGIRAINGSQILQQRRRLLQFQIPLESKIKRFRKGILVESIQISQNILALHFIQVGSNSSNTLTESNPQRIKSLPCTLLSECKNEFQIVTLKSKEIVCVKCAQKKQFNLQKEACVCKSEYIQSGEDCVTPSQYHCGPGENFYDDDCHKCVVVPRLPRCASSADRDPNTMECTCKNGEQKYVQNGVVGCKKICPIRSYLNTTSSECQCYLSNQYFNTTSWQCESCTISKFWDPVKKQCQCKKPLLQNRNRVCIYCSINGKFDDTVKDCVCNPGYEGNGIQCKEVRQTVLTQALRNPF